ncbi:hypothetical protein [Aeromonas schubertii]|uniref:Uncharacterized protein n=2 Tax=Aeromonas schubertii TaxID=652 RepID=A0ABS7V8J8_9GAMM|nr:hypothetical protein [Aeromonas schubertii]KUE78742.1 hypothetical protein ATO46_08040 [Aeromonas schubertii]MBZ6065678.1 hypothetical protein [Aeromonas schubertii]MBZ6072610.1 hypothetical protein [Aeromonas schubertii]QCG46978.1 hypothetical protein E2P79_03155 [Aeromonas schubertii]
MAHPMTIGQVAIPWAPSRQLSPGLVVVDLHHDIWGDTLTIALGQARSIDIPPLTQCHVYFRQVFALRVVEDGDLSDGMSSHPVEEQIQIITPSRFAAWFHQESKGVHLDEDLQHYRISTWDYCVDILTSRPPELHLVE